MAERLHVRISGDVQGVFFRAGAQDEASRLGLAGWVRNTKDGSVEAMAEGERSKLELFLEWCSHGPAGASVSRIDEEWSQASGGFDGFRIRFDQD
jgi:acylphosphatase